MRWLALRLASALVVAAHASSVLAHPLAPAAILLREQSPDSFELEFRRPARRAHALHIELPGQCQQSREQPRAEEDQVVGVTLVKCRHGLVGEDISLRGLDDENSAAVFHLAYRNGEEVRALLTGTHASLRVPPRNGSWQVLSDYLALGAKHMLAGLDHLLFATGLLLLGRFRRVIGLLSAFTLGHSVTLVLASLLSLSLPSFPIELGIALSLVGLALTVLETREISRPLWHALLLTFGVGLLHGLGFASGLSELALPRHALLTALFGFNAGVELAQLAWVCGLAPLLLLMQRLARTRPQLPRLWVGYAIGSLAAMWCIERTLAAFS